MTKFDALEEAHAELKLKDLLWKAIDEWDNYLDSWTSVRNPLPPSSPPPPPPIPLQAVCIACYRWCVLVWLLQVVCAGFVVTGFACWFGCYRWCVLLLQVVCVVCC